MYLQYVRHKCKLPIDGHNLRKASLLIVAFPNIYIFLFVAQLYYILLSLTWPDARISSPLHNMDSQVLPLIQPSTCVFYENKQFAEV